MKWIGQHIYDQISRFRSDVYLEDVSTGTIVSGGHLGLDSNNKIVKAVDGGGDLTSIVAGTGLSGTSLTGPIPTLNLDAQHGSINLIHNEALVVGRAAENQIDFATENKIKFKTNNANQVEIIDGAILPITHNDIDLGGDPELHFKDLWLRGNANISGNVSGTWTGAVIPSAKLDTANITGVGTLASGNATAIVDAASLTAAGKVELATTDEADTGTDATRAVTPAGLKSHVDAHARKSVLRCNGFYVNTTKMVQNNLYFGGTLGHQPYNWNDPTAVGGVIGDTASFTIQGGDENWGMVLPFNISKIEVQCSLRPNLGTGDDLTVAIYTGVRSNDSSAALTLTKAAHNSVALSSVVNRYTRNDVSVTADYDKNTMIYVGVGTEDDTDMKQGRGYMTITVTER
jgi:hypothetical protein